MKNEAAEKINELLRGERAAAETYRQALEKVGDDPRADGLRIIQKDHLTATIELKKHVKQAGDSPDSDSGAWGGFAKAVVGTAKLFGDQATLKALKEGEEHGLKEYRELAEDEKINSDLRSMIRTTMIPNQNSHIASINSIMETM